MSNLRSPHLYPIKKFTSLRPWLKSLTFKYSISQTRQSIENMSHEFKMLDKYDIQNMLLIGFIVERYVSNVFYSERIVRVFYSQSDKILGVFYPK